MQSIGLITRLHAAIRFPNNSRLAKLFDNDLDILLSGPTASLKQIFSRGLLTISSLIEHSAIHTPDPVRSVQLWLRLDGPPVKLNEAAWQQLHGRADSDVRKHVACLATALARSPESLGEGIPPADAISVFLARTLSGASPPSSLVRHIVTQLETIKSIDYNSALLASSLPQPAFFMWCLDEASTALAPNCKPSPIEKDLAKRLLKQLLSVPEGGLCLPGLVEILDRSELEGDLNFSSVYKVHGNVIGSLIMVSLAGKGIAGVEQLSTDVINSSTRPVVILQRKLRALTRGDGSKTVKSAGWLSIFGDFFGGAGSGPTWPPIVGGGGTGLRILALDGGGTRALVTTTILRRLCGNVPVHELFDVIVGTSAGGLLAIALGCMKMSIDDAERVIREIGVEVFAVGNNASTLQSASRFYFYGERHSSRELRRKVSGIYGDLSLLDLTVLNDSNCKVAAVSTLSSEIPAKPFLFRNYRLPEPTARKSDLGDSRESRYLGDWRHSATVAAMATTAAPTFFRPVVVKNGFSSDAASSQFQDGAMLANNPAHIALHEAFRLFPGREVAALVSIGTGRAPWERGNFSTNKASLIHSLTRDLNTLIYSATSTEAVADILADMLDKTKFFRFQPELSRIVELDEARSEILQEIVDTTDKFLDGNAAKIDAVKKLVFSSGGKYKPFSKL